MSESTKPTRTQALAGHTRKPTPAERAARAAQPAPAPAEPADRAGRLLGEMTLPATGRMGRTDAMGMLLRAQNAHVDQADNARETLAYQMQSGTRVVEAATYAAAIEAEALGGWFRKLWALGYDGESTWEELARYLPRLHAEAVAAAGQADVPTPIVSPELATHIAYQHHLREGARRFVRAAAPAIEFLVDDGDDA